jgi:PAS domain S-box-containing protein
MCEAKKTAVALAHEVEQRNRVFETSQDLILVTDTAGVFIQVSPSSLGILGYEPVEMIGHSATDFVHPDDLENARTEMRSARRLQTRSFEARYIHKDGREVPLNWVGTWSEPVRRYFFTGRDLTEKRLAESQFRQAQKMDAIGQLSGGIAHDFNNILTVITGTIGILADAVADRPELASIAKLIDNAAERGAQLTRHLLAFARKQPLQPVHVDINSAIRQTLNLLHPTLGEHIRISPLLSQDVRTALVDPNQLATAILNLALNARDAMPDGGKLMLETCSLDLKGDSREHRDVPAGEYVMIAMSDTGSGIPTHHLEKIFDPFFTTKENGKGTGLGLSMVHSFVEASGGQVKVFSEEGHGTSVKIYLPRSSGPAHSFAETRGSSSIEGGHEVVLVVEDDDVLRKHVVAQLESLGYTTWEAADSAEALAILDKPTAIDLLFTDLILPGPLNGRLLVKEALKRRPFLKSLFTSGYSDQAIATPEPLDSGVLLIAKPYRKSELARMIRMALDSGGALHG